MKVYTARQAVFNRKQSVVAYELLFRNGPENVFPKGVDPHHATSRMVLQTQLNEGINAVTQGKRALINFTEKSLLSGLPQLLPPDQVVIEILEDTQPTDEVYETCQSLFHRGYKLALDDFSFAPEWQRFFKFISLIKVDIQKTPMDQMGSWFDKVKARGNIKMLAERVETREQLEQAMAMGFDFFQGYFFCKPEIHSDRDVEVIDVVVSNLLVEATKEDININRIVSYFERDTGMAFKLLRFVNSGSLPATNEIRSIKQAVVYIGNAKLRKLVYLLASAMTVATKPMELVRLSVHRARFCELVAEKQFPALKEQAFICGLFSLLDAILDKPLEHLLSSLPLDQEICDALLKDEASPLRNMLETIRRYEEGQWYLTERASRQLMLSYEQVEEFNRQALIWSEEYQALFQQGKMKNIRARS
ncbi:EAL and HDOD domain-containing protein [Aliagarivorans taiwanensis]|uniref:EAL and HDOD domain-containing protein n=1 Tax=Aliagarivorans taiwanensis TaxID=561966 RepID=UPI0004234AB3|nr:HDOD domain-containing protein [Aliagarivorans taiwanensis]